MSAPTKGVLRITGSWSFRIQHGFRTLLYTHDSQLSFRALNVCPDLYSLFWRILMTLLRDMFLSASETFFFVVTVEILFWNSSEAVLRNDCWICMYPILEGKQIQSLKSGSLQQWYTDYSSNILQQVQTLFLISAQFTSLFSHYCWLNLVTLFFVYIDNLFIVWVRGKLSVHWNGLICHIPYHACGMLHIWTIRMRQRRKHTDSDGWICYE